MIFKIGIYDIYIFFRILEHCILSSRKRLYGSFTLWIQYPLCTNYNTYTKPHLAVWRKWAKNLDIFLRSLYFSHLYTYPVSYGTVDHLRCSLSSENQQTECSSLQSPQSYVVIFLNQQFLRIFIKAKVVPIRKKIKCSK